VDATSIELANARNIAELAAAASIVAAIVSSVVGYVSARRAAREQAALEATKATLADESGERSARRAYEYDARRRLYAEAEPLLFAMYEDAAFTLNRFKNLARASRTGVLGSWLSERSGYYMRSAVYALIVPLASVHILRHRVTAGDFSLDTLLERQYQLGKAAFRSLNRDFFFAKGDPELPYAPVHGRSLTDSEAERINYPQGVFGNDVQRAAAALTIADGMTIRAVTFDEFNDSLDAPNNTVSEKVEPFFALLTGLSATSRPVLWRMFIAQVHVYRAIRLFRERALSDRELIARCTLDENELSEFAFGMSREDQVALHAAVKIGQAYLVDALDFRRPF
jgi:hypothetical protein